jgi:hypothetical protein
VEPGGVLFRYPKPNARLNPTITDHLPPTTAMSERHLSAFSNFSLLRLILDLVPGGQSFDHPKALESSPAEGVMNQRNFYVVFSPVIKKVSF